MLRTAARTCGVGNDAVDASPSLLPLGPRNCHFASPVYSRLVDRSGFDQIYYFYSSSTTLAQTSAKAWSDHGVVLKLSISTTRRLLQSAGPAGLACVTISTTSGAGKNEHKGRTFLEITPEFAVRHCIILSFGVVAGLKHNAHPGALVSQYQLMLNSSTERIELCQPIVLIIRGISMISTITFM
jgi:hypothetical protein